MWPPLSNSGKWRFSSGSPTENVIIPVVTVTRRGPHPTYISPTIRKDVRCDITYIYLMTLSVTWTQLRCTVFPSRKPTKSEASSSKDESPTAKSLLNAIIILASWWLNHPFQKYARQIGSFPQFSGWKFQKCLSCHHLAGVYRYQPPGNSCDMIDSKVVFRPEGDAGTPKVTAKAPENWTSFKRKGESLPSIFQGRNAVKLRGLYAIWPNGIIFHQPRFPWNVQGPISLPKKLPFGENRSCFRSRANLTRCDLFLEGISRDSCIPTWTNGWVSLHDRMTEERVKWYPKQNISCTGCQKHLFWGTRGVTRKVWCFHLRGQDS